MTLSEFAARISFWRATNRIGPDIPWTHWRLHFPSLMRRLCDKNFAFFGADAEIRPGAYLVHCKQISIGRRVVIRPHTMLFATGDASIVIQDDVLVGSAVQIYVSNHRYDDHTRPIIDQGHTAGRTVVLERGCWIGAGAIILPGVTVGRNAVVGAGSVVTRDVAPGTVIAGNPAKLIRSIGLAEGV
jgi:acetyltransferase-like isoleucine patch superfamily enzyme